MRTTTLYIATSLDGYIADTQNSVDWIGGQDSSVELLDTYTPFIQDIDTIIMGKKTYDQITTELSVGNWPYPNATTYVLTHNTELKDTPDIKYRNTDICQLVDNLKQQEGKGIWICGGAEIVNRLRAKDMIDIYHITLIPVLLGGGKRLFEATDNRTHLQLIRTQHYNGIVELIYKRK